MAAEIVNTQTTDFDGHVQACVDSIVRSGDASFAELEQLLRKRGVDTKGQFAIHPDGKPNTILWAGLSKEASRIMRAVMAWPGFDIHVTDMLVYAIDGLIPGGLPLAKRNQERDYKQPRWLPTVIKPNKTGTGR